MVYGDYFPRRVNMRVPNLKFAADIDSVNGLQRIDFGLVPALSTTSLASVVLSTTGVALSLTVAAGTILLGGLVGDPTTCRWGRGLQFVGDGASTRTITVNGWDYLGQPMTQTSTLNGTTPVKLTKAFMWLKDVTFGAAADTVSVSIGTTDTLGLPYQTANMVSEMKSDVVAANAGTFTGAIYTDPQTATTGDPRGTYLPLTVIPTGAIPFSIIVNAAVTKGNLHGVAHYSA